MKRDPYKNLRYCQKIKEKECFIEADGLQKKVRKFDAMKAVEAGNAIDADTKMRQIECFWKEGWEYNHTHHIYLEPKVTRPIFYLKNEKSVEENESLKAYYAILAQYIERMKIDNEDETNFKIEVMEFRLKESQKIIKKSQMEEQISQLVEFTQPITEKQIAQLSLKHLINLLYEVSSQLISNFQRSYEKSVQCMTDVAIDPTQIQETKNIHQQLKRWIQNSEEYEDLFLEANRFQQLFMNTIKQSKGSKIFSSVICEQPVLSSMPEVIHPLFIGLYSLFSQQLLIKVAKKRRGKKYADQYDEKLILDGELLQEQFKPIKNDTESMDEGAHYLKLLKIKDNIRIEQERHSKVLFINLDGYQSEFNLQFVRNYHENIMYISFPMFQKGQQHSSYNNRFHKKIMYNFTRSDMDILGMDIDDPLEDILSKQELLFNPQKYHEVIDHIYHIQNSNIDRNKNLFVFPINFPNLKSQVEISQKEKNILGYQSYLIKFIMRDQLYNAMRNYKPTIIIISYSGKLNINNDHYLQILQQLIKIQPNIILFPNLSSVFHDKTQKSSFNKITQSIGKGILQVGGFMTERQRMMRQMIELSGQNPEEHDFFDKLAIFLKVTAGYYNLSRPFQEENLQQKYKSSRVFKYITHLYASLKNQYEHCQRRLESNSLEVAQANLQNTIKQHSKEISKSVPEYYKRLFLNIRILLQQGNTANPEHQLLAQEVRDHYPPTYEQDEPYLIKWQQIQKAEQLLLASAKYNEIAPIQLREQSPRQQYQQKSQNQDSLIWLSFCYRDQNNQIVRIYKQTSLLYKENQFHATDNSFNVIIYNIFNATETQFMHCYAKPKLNKRKSQRCKIAPISFISKQGLIHPNSNFKIWTDWSYTQTNSHIVMYWPSQFDFVTYYLYKLLGRKYEPKVMKCFYAAKKNNQNMTLNQCPFFEINVSNHEQLVPRWGTSAINADDQLYFFGGSYSGEKSYLNLQNDISTLDLTDNNLVDFSQAKVFNIRKQLYSGEAFNGRLREKRDVNSFVRPRADFQFYDREELLIGQDRLMEDNMRIVYVIGGFGQDFKTPYSLFVNHYYELRIQRSTRRLVSIHKRNIPNKIIPINIKSMTKNRGIYQKALIISPAEGKEMDEAHCRDGMTNNLHYFHHRVAYAIQKQQLNYRVKSTVAVQLFRNCKRDFIILSGRLGQTRHNRDSQQQTVQIRKVEGNNHQILVEQGQQYYLYSLQLQVGDDLQEIPLMNESIISIDSKKKMVCALIRHSRHTSNNCILACETVKPISQINQAIPHNQKHYSITLKKIAIFNENLNMHILLFCNVNEVVILHGLAFVGSKVKDYLIRMKKNNSNNTQIIKQQIPKEEVDRHKYSNITSFFIKKKNKITSINIMQQADGDNENSDCIYTLVMSMLDVAKISEGWTHIAHVPGFAFMSGKTVLKRLTFEARADNFSDPGNIILIMSSTKKTYHIRLNRLLEGLSEVNVPELIEKNDIELYKSIDCLQKILKNEELYEDMNYFQ